MFHGRAGPRAGILICNHTLGVCVSFIDPFLGVFMSFGLSGIIPAIHYVLMEGWFSKISQASLGWLILMGLLYILGALFYALRVPERWFPGKCDIWVSLDVLLCALCSPSENQDYPFGFSGLITGLLLR